MKTPSINRKAWLLAPLLCAPLLASAAWRGQSPTPTDYKRFVSPPLKDGTRYTFLYPARYRGPMQSELDVSLKDIPQPSLSPLQSLRARLHLSPRYKSLGVSIGELAASVGPQEGALRNSREVEAENPFSNTIINDARSKRQFSLTHINYSSAEEPFDREAKVVSDSFRLLPPGAPTPAP